MCGRVTLEFDFETVKAMLMDTYHVTEFRVETHEPSFNVGPGQKLLALVQKDEKLLAGKISWGFPLGDQRQKGSKTLINIRSESVVNKAMFKTAYAHRRCVILAGSYYEWHQLGNKPQPYRIYQPDRPLMAMAGLYSPFYGNEDKKRYGCAILTTDANDLTKRIHHRMPVLLGQDDVNPWLLGQSMAVKSYGGQLSLYPVVNYVNYRDYDGPECFEPL